MAHKKDILQNLGFTKLAEQIYLILLHKESCSIAELAEHTGKHRPMIYKALPELLDSHLVSKVVRGKRIVYRAESPALISSIAKERSEIIDNAIPTLLDIFHNRDNKPKVSFFEGKDGIKTVYEEMLHSMKKGESLYRYEAAKDYQKNKAYYIPLYKKRSSDSAGDIEKYVITNQKTHTTRFNRLNRFSKAVDIPFEENITQIIAGDKVIFIDYDTETAIMIENQRFMDFQKSIFKMFFKKL